MNNINAKKLQEMLIAGGQLLSAHKEEINALNVFPVPDGDTGFNMNMTISEGLNTIKSLESNSTEEISKAFSKGLLRGARGNSGVILSQYFRGFAEGLENLDEVTSKEIQDAMFSAQKRAYASVIKSVEGTILTVCREMIENAKFDENIETYFENLVEAGQKSLDDTPEKLPILKEAGVVDSGGAGFLYVIKGMLSNLKGEEITIDEVDVDIKFNDEHNLDPEDIKFKYCTEMLLKLDNPENFDLEKMRTYLESKGDSIVAISDDDILKIHVHTNEPTEVFNHGLAHGDFVHVKSENMVIQAIEAQELKKQNKKEIGIVTVSSSKEMSDLFRSFSDVEIIEGGQTLNPSVEDISKAIEKVNAKNILVLPNNSNIIMAAESAKELAEENVEIIKTKHMTEAVELLETFNDTLPFEEIIVDMNEKLTEMVNVEITTAIKDTTIEGVEIKENDHLAIVNGKIKYSLADEKELLEFLAQDFIKKEQDLITFLVGSEGKLEYVNEIADFIREELPFTEIHIYETNQPIYKYIISSV